jgi:uncharacterized protein YdeI (YjbR/CyaY-like superfamily)
MTIPEVYAADRKEWRAWLRKNHKKEKKVDLISYKKHTGKPSLTHKESMEEAICFGWIDTTMRRIDEERYSRSFCRRTDKSRWSNATLSYAKDMIKKKKMANEGLKRYEEGLKKPVIDHNLPKNPETPKDLKKLFENNKKAKACFEMLAPSYRRTFIYWIERAKRKETRDKRIKEVVNKCRDGKKQ